MKVITFNYKDSKGKESSRTAVVVQEPSVNYLTIDISELDSEQAGLYINSRNNLFDEFLNSLKTLDNEFDLNYKVRSFTPTNMSNIVSEEI